METRRRIFWAALWAFALVLGTGPVAWLALVFALVLHASLTHEVLHGHPFPSRAASEALVVINPGLFIPYLRFRDTHLAHHHDAHLTDPYDDPETNFMDHGAWEALPKPLRRVLEANNTLTHSSLTAHKTATGLLNTQDQPIRF